jgi:hypothetical protein
MWRIYGFNLSKNHPPVKQLQVHLPDMHLVSFHQCSNIQNIVNHHGVEESMLTAYFAQKIGSTSLHMGYCIMIFQNSIFGIPMVNLKGI